MRTIGNILWLVLAGLWLAIGLRDRGGGDVHPHHHHPVRAPGVQAGRLHAVAVRPHGGAEPRRGPRVLGCLGNVVWIVLVGWELAVVHLVAGVMLCLTIIGIPLGLACFKLIPLAAPALRAGGRVDRRGPAGGEGGLRPPPNLGDRGWPDGSARHRAGPVEGIDPGRRLHPPATVNHNARWSSDSSTSSSTSSPAAMPGPYSMTARCGPASRAWAKAVPGSICSSTAAQ